MTMKQLKNKLVKNVNHKYDADIYVWELENLTEDFVREMKDYIDFDELFERRSTVHPSPKFSKDFLNELKDKKNFGEWMTKESGLARYIESDPDCSLLKPAILDAFKDEILNYARTLDEDDFNDYEDFYDRCYDDEMKEWLKKEQDKYYWKDGVQYYKDED